MKATLYGLTKNKNDIHVKSQLEKMLAQVSADGAAVIDGANIAAETIYGKSIVAGSIEATQIKAGAITSDHITTNGIVADKIKTGVLRSTNGASWLNLNDGTFSYANGNFTFQNGKMVVRAHTIQLGGQEVPTKTQTEEYADNLGETLQGQIDTSIKSTEVEYYSSTSKTSPVGGVWSTTAPEWKEGRFMWSRTKITPNKGNVIYKPNETGTNISGAKGDTGSILGENQWIGHKYSYPGSTRIYPSFDHIQGLNPIATQTFDDSTKFTFNDDYYIAHFQTNLYVSIDKQITTTVIHDDDLTIYCNGEVVVSKNTAISTAYNITFNLKAGWNKIDVLLHEVTGGDQVLFGTKLSSLVEHLSYIKGPDGTSSVVGFLTNESITFPASDKGVVPSSIFTGATGTFEVYDGTTRKTGSGVAYSVSGTPSGITVSINSTTGIYTVSAMTTGANVLSGTATLRAVYGGVTIDKILTVTKALAGSQGPIGGTGGIGPSGKDATTYWINASTNAIKKDVSGAITPNAITFSGFSKTGTANPVAYAGRFIIQTSTDGVSYADAYASSANQASYTYTVPTTASFVKARYYLAGGTSVLLDEQTIPVLVDAEGLSIGGRNLLLDSRNISFVSSTKGNHLGKTAITWVAPLSARYTNPIEEYSEPFIVGQPYTFSFLATYEGIKGNELKLHAGPGLFGYTQVENSGNVQEGKFTRVWVTATPTTEGATSRFHIIYNGTGKLYVTDFKVEKGNTATDWTEAPEDVQKQIDEKASNESVDNLKNETIPALKDGLLNSSEKEAVKQSLSVVSADKKGIDMQHTTVYANTALTGTAKSNLKSAKDALNSAFTNLQSAINAVLGVGDGTRITTTQMTLVTTRLNEYGTALSTYNQRYEQAQDAISTEKKRLGDVYALAQATLAETQAKAHADGKITAEENRAIADAEAKLKEAKKYVDDVEVGGRNLVPQTNKGKTRWGWNTYSGNYSLEDITSLGVNAVKAICTTKSTSWEVLRRTLNTSLISPNTEYTISFDLYPSKSGSVSIKIVNSDGTNLLADFGSQTYTANTWNKVVKTAITTSPPISNQQIYLTGLFGVDGSSVIIANLKLEKGNKATDWTPAPEDIELAQNKKVYNPVRYIRDWLNGSSANTRNHWYEIMANDTNGTNVAQGKTVTTNGTASNLGVITDGLVGGTYSSTGIGKHYIEIDLGSVHYNIASVSTWHYYIDSRTYYETRTEVSEDGVNWYPLFDSLIEGEYAETAAGQVFPNTKAKSESLISALNTAKQLASTTSKVVINGGNITAGSIKDKNSRNTINLDNGTFTLANGNIVYNGSKLEIKSGVSFSSLDSAAQTKIDKGEAAKTKLDSKESTWDTVTRKATPAQAQGYANTARDEAKEYVDKTTGNLVNNPAVTGVLKGWSAASGLSVSNREFEGVTTQVLQSSVSVDTQNYSDWINVDPSKAYEVSMWLQKSASTGMYYLGLNGQNSSGAGVGFVSVNKNGTITSSNNTNFYFQSGSASTSWIRVVGYIMPVGTNASNMANIGTNDSVIMKQNTSQIRIRFLNWYNAGTTRQLWVANPKFVEVDPNAVMYGATAKKTVDDNKGKWDTASTNASNAKSKTDAWTYPSTTEINGDSIKTGSLSAAKITTGTMHGDRITAGTLKADRLIAGSLTIENLNSDTQSKINNGNSAKSTLDSKASLWDAKLTDAQVAAKILSDKKIKDTRKTNQNPAWYFSNYPNQIVREFKEVSVMGVGTGTYGILTTDVPWSESSGGSVKQTFRTNTEEFKRDGTTTSWSSWVNHDAMAVGAKTLTDKWAFTGKTTINGGQIEADTIKASQIDVASLSALSANLGSVTAGTIKSTNGLIDINLNTGTINLGQPLTINSKPVATKEDVDGRNYFTQTTAMHHMVANIQFFPRDPDTPNGFRVTGNSSATGAIRISNVITGNGWWTVSFDIKGSQSLDVGVTVDICDLGATRVHTNKTNTYERRSVSVNVTNYSASTHHFVDFGTIQHAYFWVDNIKVEKGNKVTDWSPAPEDTVSKDDLSTSGKVSINGGNIVAGTLTANQITAGILKSQNGVSEFNLNSGTISSTGTTTAAGWGGLPANNTVSATIDRGTVKLFNDTSSGTGLNLRFTNTATADSQTVIESGSGSMTGHKYENITTARSITLNSYTGPSESPYKNGEIKIDPYYGVEIKPAVDYSGRAALTVNGKFVLNDQENLFVKHNFNYSYINLDDINRSGAYRLGNSIGNAFPFAEYGQLLTVYGGGDTIAQMGFPYYGNRHISFRTGNPPSTGGLGSYSDWRQIPDSHNENLFYGVQRYNSGTVMANNVPIYMKTVSGLDKIFGFRGADDWIHMNHDTWGRVKIHGGTELTNLNVSGAKNAIHVTRDGVRATPAYEMAESYLGDIGSDKTGVTSSVEIPIEVLFSDTVNLDIEYHVFLQSHSEANVWVSERNPESFIVQSSKPNVSFSWELKAKRRGYESTRMTREDGMDNKYIMEDEGLSGISKGGNEESDRS